MKKIIQIIFTGILLMVVANSCKKDNNSTASGGGSGVAPENVQNIAAKAGAGYVTLSWTYPNDSSYKYVDISYQDTSGKTIDIQYGNYLVTAVISGLKNISYTFTIKAIGISGGVSTSQTVTVTPNLPLYLVVEPTLNIASDLGGVDIKWQNTTGDQVKIQATYIDADNNPKLVSDTSSKPTDSLFVWGIPKGNTTFTILVGGKTDGTGVLMYNLSPSPVKLTGSPLPINLNQFAGNYNVTLDPFADFSPNPVQITIVNDSTFSYPSPITASDGTNRTQFYHVNLYSREITANIANYGTYDGTGSNDSIAVVTDGGYLKNYVSPKDYSIYLNLDYNIPNSPTPGSGYTDYKNYPLIFKKVG